VERLTVWRELVRRGVSGGTPGITAGNVDEVTTGGPTWTDEQVTARLEIVSPPEATNEWGIGYIDGWPVLYALDGSEGPEAYPVPLGFTYEQPHQGFVWRAEVAEIRWSEHEQPPGWDGTGTIAESWNTTLRGYHCRIDRFKEEEGGGYAYSVSDSAGNCLRGAENEAADSFEEAEEAIVAVLWRTLGRGSQPA